MPISKSVLRRWMKRATLEQRKAFAKAAKTSLPHLHHITSGRRGVQPELAQRLAAASRTLHQRNLYLDQRELAHDCSICPLVDPLPGCATVPNMRAEHHADKTKRKTKAKAKAKTVAA